MKHLRLLPLLAVALFLVGCWQQSLHPFYTAGNLNQNPALLGAWIEDKDQDNDTNKSTWTFSEPQPKEYILSFADDSETVEYDVRLFRLDGIQFVDFHSRNREVSEIPAHHLFKAVIEKDKLQLLPLHPEWIAKHTNELDHIVIPDPADPKEKQIVLTASTQNLQKFIRKHLNTEGLFTDPVNLKRAKLPAGSAMAPSSLALPNGTFLTARPVTSNMTTTDILAELEALGTESYKKLLMKNHGVREPCFGVKISELKKIQKRVKTDHNLALDLYASGNYDAMYLAGLIADDARMTAADLDRWVQNASGGALSGATVPWVAAGSPHGWETALQWIESSTPHIAAAGWTTLASLVALKPDSELNLPAIKSLGARVQKAIHREPDAVRYAMNNFIIAVGCYVQSLAAFALHTAEQIGPITANLGPNQCQIPFAPDYIRKVQQRGQTGKKRKTVKC